MKDLRKNRPRINTVLQNIFNKYGEQSLQFLLLENCDTEELSRLEAHYINIFGRYCINMAPVSDSFKGSKEYREKHSEIMKDYFSKNPDKVEKQKQSARKFWDSERSIETRKSKAEKMKGMKHSDEAKKKISEALKGKNKISKRAGTKHTEETKQKMRDAWIKRKG